MLLMTKRAADTDQCAHDEAMTTITAGLERSVCGQCSRVMVSYVYDLLEETYHITEIDLGLFSR